MRNTAKCTLIPREAPCHENIANTTPIYCTHYRKGCKLSRKAVMLFREAQYNTTVYATVDETPYSEIFVTLREV